MIYTLKNEFGNVIKKISNTRKKDYLLERGYKLVTDKPIIKGQDKTKPKSEQQGPKNKRKGVKKNAAK